MKIKWLVGLVVILLAGTFWMLKTGRKALESDTASSFVQKLADAQVEFESCLFGGREAQDWGVGAAEALLGNPDLWQSCMGDLVKAADLAHQESGYGVAAIERYQELVHEYGLAPQGDSHQPGALCRSTAALAHALTTLQEAAGVVTQMRAEPVCDPRQSSMSPTKGASEDDEFVTIWRSGPALVGRFHRSEGEVYAEYHEDSWKELPLPQDAIEGTFEPEGPMAICEAARKLWCATKRTAG